MKKRILNGLLAAGGLSITALSAADKKLDFSTTHEPEIRKLLQNDGEGMADIVLPTIWYAVQGKPDADWMHPPGKGFSMTLPRECNLDKVLKKKGER